LQIEKSPHFAPLLLMIVEKYSTINSSVQFAAAVYFKNYIKRKWKQVEGETDEIQKEDRGNNL
jgi:exportin-2 (importin alpha re-exporter)